MKTKHYFLGANTGNKFISYFDEINDSRRPEFIYVLKGGSGTGKSTLMKTVAKHFEEKGEATEYFHCSSDIDSLDGIRLIKRNISILDGTAPHVVEPKIPQINGIIINLGEFIGEGVMKHRAEIERLIAKKKQQYEQIYSLLASVKALRECEKNEAPSFEMDYRNILASLKLKKLKNIGKVRNLFLTAINENGKFSFQIENEYNNVIICETDIYNFTKNMKKLNDQLLSLGYDVSVFYDTICPTLYEAVLIEKIDTLIIFKQKSVSCCGTEETQNELIKRAGKCLKFSREFHKEVEKYYIKNMDFDGINKVTKNLINKIEEKKL